MTIWTSRQSVAHRCLRTQSASMVWICKWDVTRRITENIIRVWTSLQMRSDLHRWVHRWVHRWASDTLMRRRSFDGINRQTGWWLTAWPQVRRRSVINEPAEVCLFVFRSIYSVETKTFMTLLILQHFLVHLCDFEAFTGRQAEPSQRDESVICQDRTHESESGVTTQHTCGKPHTTGGHTVNRWRLQHNSQQTSNYTTELQRPMSAAHTQTKTALTSFSSSSDEHLAQSLIEMSLSL